MSAIEELYRRKLETHTDIHELLPVLRYFASKSGMVVEFGVRDGNSTVALLAGRPQCLLSVDIERQPEVDEIRAALNACDWPTIWIFEQQNDLEIDIPRADLLFIDSEHSRAQLTAELARHAYQVRRWILLHDTVSCGPELNPAIDDFLAQSGEWREAMRMINCNGLTLLERAA